MSVSVRNSFTFLAAAFLLAGCSPPQHSTQAIAPDAKAQDANLNTAEVIRIARETAERRGADLREFKEPEAHYDPTRRGKSWRVYFDGRTEILGRHFSVSVDDQTGEAHFEGGK